CVPTMGFLHEGHLSLVKIAKEHCDVVVLSNFVNPTQFGVGEDFDKYPRNLDRDNQLCESIGVDAVFAPTVEEIYSGKESTWVVEEKLSKVLCGKSRPGHFRGVCTVVSKLFNIIEPDIAVFGQKDYQQLKIVERMIDDLNFDIKIIRGPIVREANGLAMSSRNKYLSKEEKQNASAIFASISEAEKKVKQVEFSRNELTNEIILRISHAGGKIDYVQILNAETLENFEDGKIPKNVVIAVAAFFGKTRLIDNVIVKRS
ncbi:MAG TPA: pantoate--beta-alanine ligase, partial [Victivallales bacterium]|nr:pantoate--beta-alanine ligase [Victivallales bacterium]